MTFKEYIEQKFRDRYLLTDEEIEVCMTEIYAGYTMQTYLPDLEANNDDFSDEIFAIEFKYILQFIVNNIEIEISE